MCEIGASRNFENWREAPAEDEADVEARGETEEQNPMLALEKRTEESKQEMASGRKSPLATKNLLEDTDGLRRPP